MKRGFTLVELSIVLVIIGLLTGGVLAGQALIRSAKIHSLTKTFEQYEIAIVTFKNIYGTYPGDNGVNGDARGWNSYWASICGTDNGESPDTSGWFYQGYITGANGNCWPELLYVFPDLSDADMIGEKFTATPIADAASTWKGKKIPSLPDNGALNLTSTSFGWTVSSQSALSHCKVFLRAGTYYESGDYNNNWSGGYLPPSMAQGLDNKIDDGKPASGKLLTERQENHTGGCANNGGGGRLYSGPFDGSSSYNLSSKEKICTPFYCITDPTQ